MPTQSTCRRSALIAICLAYTLFMFGFSAVEAQTPQPTQEPTVAALQTMVATQSVAIQQLQRDLQYEVRDTNWKVDAKLLIATALITVVGTVAGILGIRTYNSIDDKIRMKIQSTLDQEIYQLDPAKFTIHLCEGRDPDTLAADKNAKPPEKKPEADKDERLEMRRVWQRLELSGLKNRRWYPNLNKTNYRGITIVPIACLQDEESFQGFISENRLKLNDTHAAFILYAYANYRVSDETISCYPNLALANTPTTVANAVLAVGRGLKIDPPSTE